MVDPLDFLGSEGIRLAMRRSVEVEGAITRRHPLPVLEDERTDTVELDLAQLRERASDAPVIRFVDHVVARAVGVRVPDIHRHPLDRRLRMRVRVDGVWAEVETLDLVLAPEVISRLKIIAGLDIAERRLPPDSGIKTVVRNDVAFLGGLHHGADRVEADPAR